MGILGHLFSTSAHELVGIQSRAENLVKLLNLGSDDARFVGIWGKGGIGKTTLAAAVYDTISHRFDASCFLADVTRVSTMPDGLARLQEQLLRETLKQGNLKIRDVHEGTLLIATRLRHLKILIVLDDVQQIQILEELAGKSVWFGAGSRIIVTTRDEHILRVHAVNEVYQVELLKKDEALQLFCRIAFKRDYPKRDYEELTYCAIEYVQGNPLAIKLLASFFLYTSVSQWKKTLDRLKRSPHYLTTDYVLQQSFKALKYSEKEIFLDIACFFIGEKIDYVKKVLNRRQFHPEIGIKILIERSFISISDQRIRMHDLVQYMGLEIVRRASPRDPGKRSRLWFNEDIYYVMKTYGGREKVEAIVLNPENLQENRFWAEAISKMKRLKLLIFRQYPFTCLPSKFESHGLVELIMPNSGTTQLWEGIKTLPNLTSMDLRDSRNLIKMPDFRGVPNLERLDLEGCTGLLQLHPSVAFLSKLTFLNLRNCISLVSIPNSLFGLSSLEILNLAGCSNLAECLNFDPLRSSLEVKLLSNQYPPFLAKLLYSLLISFPEDIKNNKLVFYCLSCLIDSI